MNTEDLRYTASINLAEKNSSHTRAFDMLQQHAAGSRLRVLEVGCASGYWGSLLRAQGHWVTGVEPDPASAACAEKVLDEVFCGSVDAYMSANPGARFDVISFVDVLEHTSDPEAVLRCCRALLSPGGLVIASIPNVAHLAVRAMLLSGRWDYARTGIMDDSHLRFFSRDAVLALFTRGGFAVSKLEATTLPCRAVARQYGLTASGWFRGLAWLAATDSKWRDFQYIVASHAVDGEAQAAAANAYYQTSQSVVGAWGFKLSTLLHDMHELFLAAMRKVGK